MSHNMKADIRPISLHIPTIAESGACAAGMQLVPFGTCCQQRDNAQVPPVSVPLFPSLNRGWALDERSALDPLLDPCED